MVISPIGSNPDLMNKYNNWNIPSFFFALESFVWFEFWFIFDGSITVVIIYTIAIIKEIDANINGLVNPYNSPI